MALSALTGSPVIGVFHTLSAGKAGQEVPGSTVPAVALSVWGCRDEAAADDGPTHPWSRAARPHRSGRRRSWWPGRFACIPSGVNFLCISFHWIGFAWIMVAVLLSSARLLHGLVASATVLATSLIDIDRIPSLCGQPVELVEQLVEQGEAGVGMAGEVVGMPPADGRSGGAGRRRAGRPPDAASSAARGAVDGASRGAGRRWPERRPAPHRRAPTARRWWVVGSPRHRCRPAAPP